MKIDHRLDVVRSRGGDDVVGDARRLVEPAGFDLDDQHVKDRHVRKHAPSQVRPSRGAPAAGSRRRRRLREFPHDGRCGRRDGGTREGARPRARGVPRNQHGDDGGTECEGSPHHQPGARSFRRSAKDRRSPGRRRSMPPRRSVASPPGGPTGSRRRSSCKRRSVVSRRFAPVRRSSSSSGACGDALSLRAGAVCRDIAPMLRQRAHPVRSGGMGYAVAVPRGTQRTRVSAGPLADASPRSEAP